MREITRIRDVLEAANTKFGEFLKKKRPSVLVMSNPDDLVAEFTKMEGLRWVALSVDESRQPEVKRTSEGSVLSVFFTPPKADTFDLLGKVWPSKWSSDFNVEQVRSFRADGTVSHPTSMQKNTLLVVRENIVAYVHQISSEIERETPPFLMHITECAVSAINRAKADVQQNAKAEAETGYKVIDNR